MLKQFIGINIIIVRNRNGRGNIILNFERKTIKELSDFYNEDYFMKGQCKNISNYLNYSLMPGRKKRFQQISKEIIKIFNPETILDAGCAKGYLVRAFRQFGASAYGVDVSEYAISQAPENIKDYVQQGLIQELPYPNDLFDMVICRDVMEHIPEKEVDKVFSEFSRVCKKYIVILVLTKYIDWDVDKSHITIKPKHWWEEKLSKYFTIEKVEDRFNPKVFNHDYLIVVRK